MRGFVGDVSLHRPMKMDADGHRYRDRVADSVLPYYSLHLFVHAVTYFFCVTLYHVRGIGGDVSLHRPMKMDADGHRYRDRVAGSVLLYDRYIYSFMPLLISFVAHCITCAESLAMFRYIGP